MFMKKIPVTVIVVVVAGIILYLSNNGANSAPTNSPPPSFAKMSSRELALVCLPKEGQGMHIHSHLSIIADKKAVAVPEHIGVDETKNCIHALHTHENDAILHVESPVTKNFTLGDFFAVSGKTFNKSQVLDVAVDSEHGLKIYVDGKESTDFENLLLKDHQEIFIDYYRLQDGPDAMPKATDWSKF